ncbi:polysaccharide deacetylase family protein [Blautia sp. MSJ-19]|nr:polysaccharide deacetylase family protein [Blautia sp. MSJ-19]
MWSIKSDSEAVRTSGRAVAETIAGQGMLRLVEQSIQEKQLSETVVTEGCSLEEQQHPQAALTFDDGPDARYTPLLLDGFKERNIKASFFLLGEKIEKNKELVKRIQEEGHLVGNHTYHHVQLDKLNETKAREEILKTNNVIFETTGNYPQYMRPPFGAWKKNLELCVEMLPVFWTIDTLDWKVQNTEKIIGTVQEQIKDGSIILMHDEYATTVDAALRVADSLKEQGYELVTVDQLIVP